jgi:FixJ family two-component response regulator
MTELAPTVFVVDDDASVRRSLSRLLKSAGYQVELFGSAVEFLESGRLQQSPACLVLDLRMPGLTGMDLQARLRELNSSLSIIFITGHGDIPTSVRAMKEGAVDFLPKPFDDTQLLEAVIRAIERNRRESAARSALAEVRARYETLTAREREVMALIVTGRLNKQVADALGTVEKTVKVHRARVFEKMAVQSLAELIPLAEKLGLLAAR